MIYVIVMAVILLTVVIYMGRKKRAEHPSRNDWKPDPPPDDYEKLNFLIYDDDEPITPNVWYRRERWRDDRLIAYSGTYDRDWKKGAEVRLAGNTIGNRREMFLRLMNTDGFKFTLENEPDNPVNKNARKVMAWGTIDGQLISAHIGYLPDEVANEFAGVEMDVRPKAVLLPDPDFPHLSIELTLLVRSVAYLKRMAKAT